MTRVLGIAAFFHDSAAALVADGAIVAAAQEERFSRRKHDPRFPNNAIAYCLEEGRTSLAEVDYVVFYEKPFLKFERLLETYLAFAPRGFRSFSTSVPLWIREKLFQKDLLRQKLQRWEPDFDWQNRLLFSEHHLSHAASAYYPSPYDQAVVLTIDGVGEWSTTSVAIGKQTSLKIHKEIQFPHSLGLLYSAFTYFLGFRVNSGEYKMMGLAPYGEPKYVSLILDNLIDLKSDGTFRLDLKFFDYCTGLTMTNRCFEELFGIPARQPSAPLDQLHMDIAASIQAVTETVIMRLAQSLSAEYGIPNLCLAGGVALNCVANGKLQRDGPFENIWVQPAAGDAGGALGAALAAWHQLLGNPHTRQGPRDKMHGSYLGPSFPQSEIERRLNAAGARYSVVGEEQLLDDTASVLASGMAVGWMQGRMEYGPRALGARSILGNPQSPSMQKLLNLKVKYRESFRPFAPAVLRENVADWFDLDIDSPYMAFVAPVRIEHRRSMSAEERDLFGIDKLNVVRSTIPAVTHVDYTARVQTVHADTNPRFYALLKQFATKTGCPVLINTSFNVRGEPIVCTPEDAFRCFMGTEIDFLVAGNCILRKADQDPSLKLDYQNTFEPD